MWPSEVDLSFPALAFRCTENAIASACLFGFPAASSLPMFFPKAPFDADLVSGMRFFVIFTRP